MILKRKNPNANRDNVLQITTLDGLCCGDDVRAILCVYEATVDTSSVTTASLVSIGGTEYAFGMAISLTTEAGRKLLKAAIKDALHEAGYTTDGVEFSVTGDDLTITTGYSQVAFDYLQAAGNAFAKTTCKAVGPVNVEACLADVSYAVADGFFVIEPVAANAITNVVVNDATADRYDAALVYDSGTPAGNASSVNGKIYLSIAGFTYTGAEVFTVTISSQGCEDAVLTINYTFA